MRVRGCPGKRLVCVLLFFGMDVAAGPSVHGAQETQGDQLLKKLTDVGTALKDAEDKGPHLKTAIDLCDQYLNLPRAQRSKTTLDLQIRNTRGMSYLNLGILQGKDIPRSLPLLKKGMNDLTVTMRRSTELRKKVEDHLIWSTFDKPVTRYALSCWHAREAWGYATDPGTGDILPDAKNVPEIVTKKNDHLTAALKFLKDAIGQGFKDSKFIMKDPDLVFLRQKPEFMAALGLDAPTATQEGHRLVGEKKWGAAIPYYTHALSLAPNSLSALNGRGVARVYWIPPGAPYPDYDAAGDDFKKMLEIDPKHANGPYGLACVHSLKSGILKVKGQKDKVAGEIIRALDYLEQSVDRGWKDVKWMVEDEDLGALRQEPRFMKVLKRLNLDFKTSLLEGGRLSQEEKWGAAQVYYSYALTIDPSSIEALNRRGITHLYLTRGGFPNYDAAERDFKEIIRLNPNDPASYYNLACLHSRRQSQWILFGQPEKVAQETEKALDYLEKAVEVGWKDIEGIKKDPDLKALRNHPRFKMLTGASGQNP